MPQPPVPPPPSPSPSRSGMQKGLTILGRIKAGFLVLTVLLAMAACLLIHPLLRKIATEHGEEVNGYARAFLDKPWIGVLLGLPALAVCVPLLKGSRRPILWMTLGTILALLPVIFIFLGFLGVLAPLYEYRPL